MWTLSLSTTNTIRAGHDPTVIPTSQANNLQAFPSKADLVQFLHGAAGYPVPSTWIQAIESGHYNTWPGLTAPLVRKHLPKSPATVKGHMQQQRQGIRSTKPPAPKEFTGVSQVRTPRTNAM
jgi:hypothetical protein